MAALEKKTAAKIPGADTGIYTRNSVCDVCAPGPHCGVTCYVKDGVLLKVEGTDAHPTNRGLLCPRGQAMRQYVYRQDRVRTPLRRVGARGEGRFVPISWEEALTEVADRLGDVRAKYGASSVAFYSGYNKWYRPFLQRLAYSFGSVNYGTESSSCFMASSMSWLLATGYDVAMPDIGRAGIFLGWCYNAYYSQYLMAGGVERARARGMKVIIVDPRITPAVEKQCDLHLQIRPGTDCALALCLGRELICQDWIDKAYIAEHVYGFEAYRDYVMDFTPERTEAITGVSAEKIRLAARMIHENMPLAINQSGAAMVHSKNGLQTHRAVMALCALMGTFDRPGGMLPQPMTYAHSMGGFDTLDHAFAFAAYPKDGPVPVGGGKYPLWLALTGEMQANDLARQIHTGEPYPVRAVYAHGMNYRMFNGDTALRQALLELDFFVDIDLFLTDTAKLADIVLPACSSLERGEFKVFNGGYVQYTEPVIAPLGESRSDTEILFALAEKLDVPDSLLRAGYDACLRDILRCTGIDLEKLKAAPQLPQKAEGVEIVPVGCHDFKTPTGKFELVSTVIAQFPGLDALPTYREAMSDDDAHDYPFRLVAGARLPFALHSRLHDVPWLRAQRSAPAADISPEDARSLGVAPGDDIVLRTSAGAITVKANPTSRVSPGTVYMYHGYREADVNAIIPPGHNDPYSGFPGYRSVRVAVERKG